ncbi:hypothetical protein PG996_011312 [Apiospora saccharicola]|uniref:Amidase domain-containing protein n=1 Tax=Apiospora saccharicola TaxID=335842 RepID=A0ABR1UER8_9PEZI
MGAATSLSDVSIAELQKLLESGAINSRDLVELYASRIAEVNDELHAVIETDVPGALLVAETLDRERAHGQLRGPLHGIPLLVKDNYATSNMSSHLRTGAGSVCLAAGSHPAEDATVVAKLRAAGAIILGKTNQAEFSGARGRHVPQGWSARGGQTYGAYVKGQTACGSSSGSGVAAGLGLAAAALGTETAGSITCPASFGNVVGIKPTVGLTSRFGIVQITARQDTAGPLARSVGDAAVVLEGMAGRDVGMGRDNYTDAQPWDRPPRYTQALNTSALRGKRIGVLWHEQGIGFGMDWWANKRQIRRLFDAALDDLRRAGAELVDLLACLRSESRERAAEYSLEVLADIAEEEKPLLPAGGAEAWTAYMNRSKATGSFIRKPRRDQKLDGLVMYMDLAIALASAPGLPIVTVPMGGLGKDAQVVYSDDEDGALPRLVVGAPGMPQGLSFVGEEWSEMELIGFAYAYEQVSQRRGTLRPWVKLGSDLGDRIGEFGEL